MVKVYPLPLTKEQKNKILEVAESKSEFDYMLYLVLSSTGRRIGELYGVQEKIIMGEKPIKDKEGKITLRKYYDSKMRAREEARTRKIYKRGKKWRFGVQVKDINFEEGSMKIWTLKLRKLTTQDEIPLIPNVLRVMSQYIKRNNLGPNDYLFRKSSLSSIQKKIKSYAKDANVPRKVRKEGIRYSLSLHSFRHFFISELQKRDIPNDIIIKLTGHKDAKTLSNYSHTLGVDYREKVIGALKEI